LSGRVAPKATALSRVLNFSCIDCPRCRCIKKSSERIKQHHNFCSFDDTTKDCVRSSRVGIRLKVDAISLGAFMGKEAKAIKKTNPAAKPDRKLTRATLIELYAARRYLGLATLKEIGLRIPVEVYFKDPDVAAEFKNAGFDKDFTTPWEPGLRDGPTSARFAVVD